MDIANSAISTLTNVFSSFWTFAMANELVGILMVVTLVGACIGLFMSIKSRLVRKK